MISKTFPLTGNKDKSWIHDLQVDRGKEEWERYYYLVGELREWLS